MAPEPLALCALYLQPTAKSEIVWDSANQGEERGGKGELWFLLEFCDKGCLQVGLGPPGSLMLCTAYICSLRSVSWHAACTADAPVHLEEQLACCEASKHLPDNQCRCAPYQCFWLKPCKLHPAFALCSSALPLQPSTQPLHCRASPSAAPAPLSELHALPSPVPAEYSCIAL